METIKNFKLVYCFAFILLSCKGEKKAGEILQDDRYVFIDTFQVSDKLKLISKEFIENYKLINSNVEVNIDKREFNRIIITFTCRGMADFGVKNFKPLFQYKIYNNTFFVFTGAEELLLIPFDESKYKNQKQGRCYEVVKSCYILEDNVIRKEIDCTDHEPFSSIPAPSKLPPSK